MGRSPLLVTVLRFSEQRSENLAPPRTRLSMAARSGGDGACWGSEGTHRRFALERVHGKCTSYTPLLRLMTGTRTRLPQRNSPRSSPQRERPCP
jgi:hypothetical protein